LNTKMRIPAKINLWLEVVRKREDGYHDLSSLMLPVSVFDRLTLRAGPETGPITLACGFPDIPVDGRNLAWRAADAFRKAARIDTGIHITLDKAIPAGAGLGGGSADAAAVLLGLNAGFDNPLAMSELEGLALRLGADVPFFLHRKAALATGIGEKLEFLDSTPNYPLVLIKPPISVPTAWVYQSLKLTRGTAQIKLNRFMAQSEAPGLFMENDLESVTVPKYPVIGRLKTWLIEHGAVAASMSGSGPTVFGVFDSLDAARAAEAEAGKEWENFWVKAAEVLSATDGNPGFEGRSRKG